MEDFIENLSTLSSSSSTFFQEAVRQKKLVRVFCTNTTKTLKLFPKMGIFAIDHIAAGSKCDPLWGKRWLGKTQEKCSHVFLYWGNYKNFSNFPLSSVGQSRDIFRILLIMSK